jgi:hypothetical protein
MSLVAFKENTKFKCLRRVFKLQSADLIATAFVTRMVSSRIGFCFCGSYLGITTYKALVDERNGAKKFNLCFHGCDLNELEASSLYILMTNVQQTDVRV